MTCTFRAPGSAATRLEKGNIPPITRAEVHAPGGLSLDRRLQLVANSLLLYGGGVIVRALLGGCFAVCEV